MSRIPRIPPGAWPPLMTADIAAAYMGERSVEAFQRRVGKVYPRPRKISGRGSIWLKEDLDEVVAEISGKKGVAEDAASLL